MTPRRLARAALPLLLATIAGAAGGYLVGTGGPATTPGPEPHRPVASADPTHETADGTPSAAPRREALAPRPRSTAPGDTERPVGADRGDNPYGLAADDADAAAAVARAALGDPERAASGARVLVSSGAHTPDDLTRIESLLDDPRVPLGDREVVAALLLGLRIRTGDPGLARFVARLMERSPASVRASTMAGLSTAPSAVIPLLIQGLRDPEPAVAHEALEALRLHGRGVDFGADPGSWSAWWDARTATPRGVGDAPG